MRDTRSGDPPSSEWGVYILRCNDETLYTGITNRISHRLRMHRAGKGSRYTRARLPLAWVYWESMPDKSTALRREREIKTMPRRAKLELIALHGLLTAPSIPSQADQ